MPCSEHWLFDRTLYMEAVSFPVDIDGDISVCDSVDSDNDEGDEDEDDEEDWDYLLPMTSSVVHYK